jgi:hypothetical protein
MLKKLTRNLAISAAMGGLLLTPATLLAQGKGNKGWNPAPPKKNGRHDNRDWNKKDKSRNDDWRRQADYDRRREDELRRQRELERQREQERRRWEEAQRRNDSWLNDTVRGSASWEADRRQQTKNEWRNLAYAAGAVAVLGLLKKDNTLTFAGAAGALYSLYRYEQDRKSQNQLNRTRAYYFSQPYFYRDGVRYDRRTVTRNGQKYYQFVRR